MRVSFRKNVFESSNDNGDIRKVMDIVMRADRWRIGAYIVI